MRAFLFSFGDFSVAIPMDSVSSLALHDKNAAEEDCNIYISLPELLHMPGELIRHDIVLKDPNVENDENDEIHENKTILFIPEIEGELEIPDEEVFPVPKVLSDTHFSELFRGIQFDSRKLTSGTRVTPLLLLDSEALLKSAPLTEALP